MSLDEFVDEIKSRAEQFRFYWEAEAVKASGLGQDNWPFKMPEPEWIEMFMFFWEDN